MSNFPKTPIYFADIFIENGEVKKSLNKKKLPTGSFISDCGILELKIEVDYRLMIIVNGDNVSIFSSDKERLTNVKALLYKINMYENISEKFSIHFYEAEKFL